ncbi:hypothetical protein Adt_41136 [Abeliophyllum distichum]|uniref:Uncharacterized protein n=1 Tax=Abeliophyllum distichum TaxID=126358 RepID=A0ABD1PMZ7_9LAMI
MDRATCEVKGQWLEAAFDDHEYHLITKVDIWSSNPRSPGLQRLETTYFYVDIYDFWTMDHCATYFYEVTWIELHVRSRGNGWKAAFDDHEYHLITKVDIWSSNPRSPGLQRLETTYFYVYIYDFWTMDHCATYFYEVTWIELHVRSRGNGWKAAFDDHEYHLITKVDIWSSNPRSPGLQRLETTYFYVYIYDFWTMDHCATYFYEDMDRATCEVKGQWLETTFDDHEYHLITKVDIWSSNPRSPGLQRLETTYFYVYIYDFWTMDHCATYFYEV